MSLVKPFFSKRLYPAVGPYSSATLIKGTSFTNIHTSGLIALDKTTLDIVSPLVSKQADLAIRYLIDLIEEIGGKIDNISKVNIYLTDMDDFNTINEVYKLYFVSHFPSRSCVQVGRLPKNARFEIEAVAYVENDKIIV